MVSPKLLLSTVESSLLGPSPPSPRQRLELMHTLRSSFSTLQSFLIYPGPKASDRTQVLSKEIRLPDSSPISLDDQDVHIALKLSDDLNLNEIDCVALLVSAHQEWGFFGREPLEILRLAEGLWYTERRAIISTLYALLRTVVLDQGLDADLVADIQKYLEDLFKPGDSDFRQRLIALIKELNREEPAGLGGPHVEHHVLDSRGALVERQAVVCRERLSICHCLVLSVLVTRISPKDAKDILLVFKDCAAEVSDGGTPLKLKIAFGLMFCLVIALISDALSAFPEKSSVLSQDSSFRREFHELVMAPGNDPNVEGFLNCVRLSWGVHMMLIQERSPGGLSSDLANISSCLDAICSNNVFQFLLGKILRTAAYQNDDEDMVYMYNAYMHKLITCFLSHPLAREKVKEVKEKAMNVLSPYFIGGSNDFMKDDDTNLQQNILTKSQPFISLLELVSEIYQREPELLSGNEVVWTFVNFAGEDHTNFQSLVAFLRMLGTLASSEEGATRVFELLNGKTFRSVGWNRLFDCLSIYEQKFKQFHQSSGTVLPEFQEGDAKALVSYLEVLQKVVENGNPIERKKWFPDIEPLFKLLGYENVPPYLKGALRNAIASFLEVSPVLKDTIWSYLEQYDLPVVVGPPLVGNTSQPMSTQVYDMRFELDEVEARGESYPSTISFLKLLNALLAKERDLSDRGRRFVGIFRFVYDHVFGPFPQRAYADPVEKWQLVVACLTHFRLILTMYDVKEEDRDSVNDPYSQHSVAGHPSAPLEAQIPILELLKDFMSGRTVFRNIMGILSPGVNSIIHDRTSQIYGPFLEKAVHLSLEIILLVLDKDPFVADYWCPLYQPLDIILSQDHNQVVTLLEFVRYDFLPQIQLCSIKLMTILSYRMVGLVQLLLKSNAANCIIEDYAGCLELRSEECQVIENTVDDVGILIMQLLIDNINRPQPNMTHLLLKFDIDTSVERTVLEPKYHYSCLKVILDILENFSKLDVNASLHEFGFQLLYELCLDPLTGGPMMDLLSIKKYQFFSKQLDTIATAPLPKRNANQTLRISSLHQRAWLLKLLSLELHVGGMAVSTHREACLSILSRLFAQGISEYIPDPFLPDNIRTNVDSAGTNMISKSKVLELLDVVQFRCPDTSIQYSQIVSNMRYEMRVDDILGNPATSEKGGVYYYSERGDRLIDLCSFRDKLWQMCSFLNPQFGSPGSEGELGDLRDCIQQLLRWGWRYNKNLEEQAAQLHMLTGWSQIVEVSVSRRMSFLENRSQILFEVLDASLSGSASRDCSLKMAVILSQVALTCLAKLRDERFLCPGGGNSDNVTCLDIISAAQLSNGACHSILLKLVMAILRPESSEALRRRQYALLLSYFQYCRSMLDPDVPISVLRLLLHEEQDGEEDLDLQKIDKELAELAQANFSILKKEAQAVLDVVAKDATHGSEGGKAIALYVLDALISIDQDRFFLNQLQSRGFLRSCLSDISNFTSQEGQHRLDSLQRLYTLQAELALLLRIGNSYQKHGTQILFSMGSLEHLASCKTLDMQLKGSFRWVDGMASRDSAVVIDRQSLIIPPVLRLVYCMTSLLDISDYFEVKNKIVHEVMDFVRGHQRLFDQVLREEVHQANCSTLEEINLVVAILGKVWPYEESDEYGFIQSLFGLMRDVFVLDVDLFNASCLSQSIEFQKKSELMLFRLSFNLGAYLYFLVTKKKFKLQISDSASSYDEFGHPQPTLISLVCFLDSVTTTLVRASEEKSLLLNKIQDVNDLSRQEVDEIISMCMRQDCVSATDNIRKRRYIAMVEMCQVAGNREQLITLLLKLSEHVLNILLIHLQDSSKSTKMVAHVTVNTLEEDISKLCKKLLPIVESLESLNEDKTGHSLKLFHRLVGSLKELSIQQLAP